MEKGKQYVPWLTPAHLTALCLATPHTLLLISKVHATQTQSPWPPPTPGSQVGMFHPSLKAWVHTICSEKSSPYLKMEPELPLGSQRTFLTSAVFTTQPCDCSWTYGSPQDPHAQSWGEQAPLPLTVIITGPDARRGLDVYWLLVDWSYRREHRSQASMVFCGWAPSCPIGSSPWFMLHSTTLGQHHTRTCCHLARGRRPDSRAASRES